MLKNFSKSSLSESISASAVTPLSQNDLDKDQSDSGNKNVLDKPESKNSISNGSDIMDAFCVPSSNQRCFSQVLSKFELDKYQHGPNLIKLSKFSIDDKIIEDQPNEMDV